MRYAILGPGNVGTTIGRAVTAASDDVTGANIDPSILDTLSTVVPNVTATTDPAEKVTAADVVTSPSAPSPGVGR